MIALGTPAGSRPASPGSANEDALFAILSGRVGHAGDGGIVSRLDGAPAHALVETSGVALTRDALVALERERPHAVDRVSGARLAAWMATVSRVREEAL